MAAAAASKGVVSFAVGPREGRARAGTLSTPHGSLETPGALLCTARGLPHHLSRDSLAELPLARGCLVCAGHLSRPGVAESVRRAGGLHGYTGLPGHVLAVDLRDPRSYGLGGLPGPLECPKPGAPPPAPARGEGAAKAPLPLLEQGRGLRAPGKGSARLRMETPGGVTMLGPEDFSEALGDLRPDLCVAMGDERAGANALKRTREWAEHCLRNLGAGPGAAGILLPVAGGADPGGREVCSRLAGELAAEHSRGAGAGSPDGGGVVGFALSGFGTGEPPEARPALIERALAHLPGDGYLRYMGGAACGPREALEAVACGVDLIDAEYPLAAAEAGYALSFPLEMPMDATPGPGPGAAGAQERERPEREDPLKFSLWGKEYERSTEPLVAGCTCYTCSRPHSRAYLHHLLQVREMNAQVLLEIHNTHHYMKFFESCRAAIRRGHFQRFHKWFCRLDG